MVNPFEQPVKTEKIKSFDELSKEEQIARFKNLKVLFADKDKDGLNQDEKSRANYMDFFENVYKYLDKFEIPGADESKKQRIFETARAGNAIIKQALEFFLAVQKRSETNNKSGDKQLIEKSAQEVIFNLRSLKSIIDTDNYGFADQKTHQLYIDKLKNFFKWSLETFILGGEKIGRTQGVKKEEIEILCNDLESILRHVNGGR